MALTAAQQDHVNGVYPECRAQMADYLERGVEVVVFRQSECGSDVPPFAVAPKADQAFWVGCWETAKQATACATELGLRVVTI